MPMPLLFSPLAPRNLLGIKFRLRHPELPTRSRDLRVLGSGFFGGGGRRDCVPVFELIVPVFGFII